MAVRWVLFKLVDLEGVHSPLTIELLISWFSSFPLPIGSLARVVETMEVIFQFMSPL